MLPDTPLCNALKKQDYKTAEELLKDGEILPDGINDFDLKQVYDNLIRNKAFSILDIFIDKGLINTDIYEYDSFKSSIFENMFAYMPDGEEELQFLKRFLSTLDNINDEVEGYTLLSFSLEMKAQPGIIRTLIDAGLRTDFKNNAEDNLINQAVRINMIPNERQLAYIDMLLKAGVDLNEPNVVKQTALHIAVERDKNHLLETLLANGAQPNLQDNKGNSAFYYALAHKLSPKVYKILSAHEAADFSQRNREDQTVLSEYLHMMQGGKSDVELVEQLLEDGASLEESAPWYSNNKSGWDWIVEKPIEILEIALKKTGKDVNEQDNDGNTLLHKVCAIDPNYSQEVAKALYKKAKLLLEAGADVSITNNNDETAFMLASKDNLKAKLAEMLLTKK
ncbi:MAG: ankyrin repeat domain-containing protein [Chitinophagaceae bacterium]|nr:ankyrin repeat domain-containing protein [Chitinophagaceae bacterium]